MTVTFTQIIFTILTVVGVFLNKYNEKSDALEASENKTYDIKIFWKHNVMNILSYIISGVLVLFITNEIGLDYIVKSVSGVDFSGIQEKAADITIAVISGIFGKKVFNLFKKK